MVTFDCGDNKNDKTVLRFGCGEIFLFNVIQRQRVCQLWQG
jgi:hypothetical protein